MSVAISRYETPAVPAPAALQRGDGAAEIAFVRQGRATALSHLFQRTPCRVLFPRPETEGVAMAVLLTTSGGLAGGDRLRMGVTAQAGAAAVVTTQAAEKVYRSLGPDCRVDVSLAVAEGGWLEWLPQETILFDGARFVRRTEAAVAPGGRLLAAEMIVFGRVARGERFAHGIWHDAWRIRSGDRLIWADALRLDGDIAASAGFDGARALASAVYVGADAAALLPQARRWAEAGTSRGGATLVNGVLLARFLGARAEAVRYDLARYLMGLRHAASGLPAALPRVWHS